MKEILIAIDQLANACTKGGWADETISSRSWRERKKHPSRFALIDAFFGYGHCKRSYMAEKKRLQEPPALRKHD